MALVAIHALVLQALLTGLVLGASAAPLRLDGTGAVICTLDGGRSVPAEHDPARHEKLPDCCMAGCAMFAPVLLPDPDVSALAAPVALAGDDLLIRRAAHRAPSRAGIPGNPRAPPLTA